MTNAATTKPAVNDALTQSLVRQSLGYHFGPQAEHTGYDKLTNIVAAKNGVFRVVKTAIAIFTTKIGDMKEGYIIPGLPEMTEGIELLIPKIPFKYWLQPLSWYKDIQTKDATEASILFFWNHDNMEIPTEYTDNKPVHGVTEDGQLIVYCPQQKNSAGLSEFHNDGMVKWLRENTTPLLETHSHHVMDAYFSSTDDANENFYQFYAVYGKITEAQPKFAFRFCSAKHKVLISPWELFEKPEMRVAAQITIDGKVHDIETPMGYNGPWPKVEYPEDWMTQHSTTTRTVGGSTSEYWKDPELKWEYGKIWSHQRHGYVWADDEKKTITSTSGDSGGSHSTGQNGQTGTTEKNGRKRDVIETETSRVEVIADDVISKFTRQQIIDLVVQLCECGYDYWIHEGLQEGQGIYTK